MDLLPAWAVSVATVLLVVASIEGGYRLGQSARRRSDPEKEAPVSAIAGAILALLAFILAFTFGIVSDRYEARKGLVREEANAIRTAVLRSEFLPEPQRAEAGALLRRYLTQRLAAVEAGQLADVTAALAESARLQRRLWDMAVAQARLDMNSDVAALYIESLDAMITVGASRKSIGLDARIPVGIWWALHALLTLSMLAVGYHAAIAGSSRTGITLVLALSFSLVLTLITVLDRTHEGYAPVSQQPLRDVLDAIGERAP